MDSLANYGSDDDCEESSDEQGGDSKDWKTKPGKSPEKEANVGDANYEEVQMDLSDEESNGSGGERGGGDEDRSENCQKTKRFDAHEKRHRRDDLPKSKYRDSQSRSRSRSREKKLRDRGRDRKDNKYTSKYESRKQWRSPSGGRPRRSNSRDKYRRNSRSPRRDRSRRSRSRSRSRGKFNNNSGNRRFNVNKFSSATNKSESNVENNTQSGENNRFFMPGITGKYREQIEKRKLLWQKKDQQSSITTTSTTAMEKSKASSGHGNYGNTQVAGTGMNRGTKLWEATTFAQDQDGKVASKFKRLMGIKNQTESNSGAPIDIIKKQEEMFSSMEQQYEVARTATHTMRGVGLGFSSSYPR